MEDNVKKKINVMQCDGCGATMLFDPESGSLKCPYCKSTKAINASKDVTERDFSELQGAEKWKDGIKTVECPNCGAREIYQADEVAKDCPFCGTSMILKMEDISGIKPNVVIPFKITADDAAAECKKWLKGRLFSPGKFKKEVNPEKLQGIYYPVWTFDSNVITDYHGVLGKHVTRTRSRNGKTETYTTTEYFPVRGQSFDMFDDIMVNGGNLVDDSTVDAISFAQGEYVTYSDAYLSGYSANSYSVEPKDAWVKAEQKMREEIKREIMRKHNADVVQSLTMNLYHEGRSFKYMLVPIYVSTVKWKKKLYRQIVRGTGGKVKGKAPISPLRVTIAVLLGIAAIVGIYFLFFADNALISEGIKQLVSCLPVK